MSNSMKGMLAGLVATLVLSGLLLFKGTINLVPELSIISLLMSLGSITAVQAWMDHFIVGVVAWGLAFGAYDSLASRPAHWLKGIIFGVFAWVVMMVLFMPLAKAGVFGWKIGPTGIRRGAGNDLRALVRLGARQGARGLAPNLVGSSLVGLRPSPRRRRQSVNLGR